MVYHLQRSPDHLLRCSDNGHLQGVCDCWYCFCDPINYTVTMQIDITGCTLADHKLRCADVAATVLDINDAGIDEFGNKWCSWGYRYSYGGTYTLEISIMYAQNPADASQTDVTIRYALSYFGYRVCVFHEETIDNLAYCETPQVYYAVDDGTHCDATITVNITK